MNTTISSIDCMLICHALLGLVGEGSVAGRLLTKEGVAQVLSLSSVFEALSGSSSKCDLIYTYSITHIGTTEV